MRPLKRGIYGRAVGNDAVSLPGDEVSADIYFPAVCQIKGCQIAAPGFSGILNGLRISLPDIRMHAEEDVPVLHFNDARRTEHADPAAVCDFRHPDPGGHDPPAFRVQCGLRGVQVKPVIQILIIIRNLDAAGGFIKCDGEADGLVPLFFSVV